MAEEGEFIALAVALIFICSLVKVNGASDP